MSPNLLDFDLHAYFKSDRKLPDHLFGIGEHKAFLKRISDNIHCLQEFRKDFNPTIGNEITGEERSIQLLENESLIEEAYIYIDFNENILVMQKNRNAYNAGSLQDYMVELLRNKFENNSFVCEPILSQDGIEKLINHSVIKTIDVSVAAPSIGLFKKLGFDHHQAMDIDERNINTIEIKITSKKRRGLGTIDKFKDFFKQIGFKKLKVRASSSYEGTGDDIDLLNDLYIVSEKIKVVNKKFIDKDDIVRKIRYIYDDNIKPIKELIK